MPTPTEWLRDFLQERGCEGDRPDGRPLYAYKCTTDELEEVTEILGELTGHAGRARLPLHADALFAFYGVCQESCRLKFKVMPPFFPRFQIVSFPG